MPRTPDPCDGSEMRSGWWPTRMWFVLPGVSSTIALLKKLAPSLRYVACASCAGVNAGGLQFAVASSQA
eukprot:2704012-Rhodomonas_salina.1